MFSVICCTSFALQTTLAGVFDIVFIPEISWVETLSKGNIFVVPIYERAIETKTIVFDKNINRQASVNSHGKARYLDKSDVYEQKYISKKFNLTKYDKAKIKEIFRK